MKLPRLDRVKKIKWNYLALAFCIPFVGMLGVMIFSQYVPFGRYSMLYSDMYHQYYPFFVTFRDALRSGKGLFYTWSVGMGMDYLGLISYYLASPLNLLSVLVPENLLLPYFAMLMPIKLGLAGLAFAWFLKKTFRREDLSISLFGGLYALCAWALGYQWNVMWLDTFALLPVVAVGTVALLRDKKFVLYTISLFLSIFTNYYIGLFTCIFVFLLFFCYEICRFRGIKRFFADLVRIACFSVLAIGMTAILEIPALAALQNTHSAVNNFPEGFRLNIASENTWQGLLDAMRQVAGNMAGGLEPTFKEGLPNLYCGVGSIFFGFLFLTAKRVKLRDKLCALALLIFFMLSFIIRQLDYIWHGFHFTNMIPYRFSFLFSFVLLYMAYRAYLMRRVFQLWQYFLGLSLTLAVLACSNQRSDPVFLIYNLAFLFLYVAAAVYGNHNSPIRRDAEPEERQAHLADRIRRRELSGQLLLGLFALELVANLVNFGVYFPGVGISNYPSGKEYAASMIRYMKEREEDNLFYRAEVTHSQTLNDGAINGYNGISTFTSSANVKVTLFMQALGYGARNTYNRYCFEESSPVANLFLGLKYMLERDGRVEANNYFDEVHHYGNVYLLENNAYLPLGFLADTQLSNVQFSTQVDKFTLQNELLRAASGITGDVWDRPGTNTQLFFSDTATITNQSGNYCSYENGDGAATITYEYQVDREGLLCVFLDLSKSKSFSFWLNGAELYSESYSLPQMLAVNQVSPGDTVQVRFNCDSQENGTINLRAGILNEEIFRQAYEVLSACPLELTSFQTTRLAGSIHCDRDGLLYTSIPQDGNWHVTVDGADVSTVLVGGAMCGVPITEGDHTVVFTYRNDAFSLGWKISALCAAIFLGAVFLRYRPKSLKGRYEHAE